MNSIGDLLPSVADTISLSLSDRAHCALPTTLGSLPNPNWERYTRLSLVARRNLVPGESLKNLVRINGFHYENLKFRKNTGTLLLCVEGSVRSEALNANA